MFFIYLLLIAAVFYSWSGKKKVSSGAWALSIIAGLLTLALFVYYALSPLEVNV